MHSVVPADRLDQTVQEYLDDILASGREAIAAAKALIRRLSHSATDDVTALTADAIARQRVSSEAQQRMSVFLKKKI